MGGTTAIGFETINGQVYYCLLGDYIGFMDGIELFASKKLKEDECTETCDSVKEFFENETLYENEDSAWRIVCIRDGRILAKRWGMKGLFTYMNFEV